MGDNPVVLITGGTGFIGSHLVADLLSNQYSVHLVVRSESRLKQVGSLLSGATIHVHDGSTVGLIEIVKSIRPRCVFHLASFFVSEHAPGQIEQMVASNVLFGTQLLEAMVAGAVQLLVNTGTSWEHFHTNAERPSCLYAATKQAFQDIVEYYCDAFGIRAITLKLFDTYGSGDTRRKLFRLLGDAASTGQALSMSLGEQCIDLVHVDDVVSAFRAAESHLFLGTDVPHEVYGVSSGNPMPLRSVVNLYQLVLGRRLKINWGERKYRDREVMTTWNGARSLPTWAPKVDLEQGLRKMLQEEEFTLKLKSHDDVCI